MKTFIYIDDISDADRELAGDKAFNLAMLKKSGTSIPDSAVLTADAYKKYLEASGMDSFILREVKRKRINDYRWEEFWDISLRIKNAFLRHAMPGAMGNNIRSYINDVFPGKAVAVRSSAPGEDDVNTSFAGLHESYINLTGMEEILKHIRLVWASLWSVTALLYRRELKLDPFKSRMAVLIQEVIAGDCSGVAFSKSPDQPDFIAVEAVYGLNQGLVDGTVEPDHWNIDRETMRVRDFFPAGEHNKIVKPGKDKVVLKDISNRKKKIPPLKNEQLLKLALEAMRQEKYFGHARDLEWTFKGAKMFILQSRPVTGAPDEPDQRQYYDKLLLSFEELQNIRGKLEKEILPGMLGTGRQWEKDNIRAMDDSGLLEGLVEREKEYRKYLDAYDKYCIPFAHGVRLFGEIYNSKLSPDDPYEFIELLRTDKLLSIQRNKRIAGLAKSLSNFSPENENDILQEIEDIFRQKYESVSQIPPALRSLINDCKSAPGPGKNKKAIEKLFIKSFEKSREASAREFLDLARASYRLRDDDNIYLDKVKKGLKAIRDEASRRLKANCFDKKRRATIKKLLSEKIPELHSPSISNVKESSNNKMVKFRQLTGQPAGKGIARGTARVVHKFDDLFAFKKSEVLVCDAVEPEMTIVAPLAAAVVERRGGMLIHGAIIAREYGLPCVTGVAEAANKIKTGDTISVDGWLGIVTILYRVAI